MLHPSDAEALGRTNAEAATRAMGSFRDLSGWTIEELNEAHYAFLTYRRILQMELADRGIYK
jgi:hypothetical protein